MKLRKITGSLRFKLIISSVVIQVVFISILLSNNQNLVEDSLLTQAKLSESALEGLLNSSISGPFIQQDYEVINEIFNETTTQSGIIYIELTDFSSKIVAAAGVDPEHSHHNNVTISQAVSTGEAHYHGSFDVVIEGMNYGEVRYAISTAHFVDSKNSLLNDSIFIAGFGIVLSVLALLAIGYWLTRSLSNLTETSHAFAAGDFSARVELTSDDELNYLGKAFNNMADSLDKRISDLRYSREMQEELLSVSNAEHARLSSLLSVMTRGIVFVTNEDHVKYFNPAFIKIWSLHETMNLKNKRLSEICGILNAKITDSDFRSFLFSKELSDGAEGIELELAGGIVVLQRSYPILDELNKEQGTLWIFEDVTKERQTARQLVHLAEHDFLTGLHNRRKFHDELIRQIAICERNNNNVSLLFFDVDDFKYINDAYGHLCGDDLLVKIAGDVGTLIRKNEMFCRLGGDEFAILLPDAVKEDAESLAQRVLNAVANISVPVQGQSLSVTSSIGIAVYPLHAADSEELLACADVAMYQAKEAGKNTWRVYEEESKSTQHLLKRIDWDTRIKYALENDGFTLNFQGVYGAESRDLKFYEALVRLKSRRDEVLEYLPGQFINFAERFGTIVGVDRIVLDKAIKMLSANDVVPCLSVNVSGRSFDDPTLDEYILRKLDHYNVDASRLIIELTETSVVSDLHDAQRFIDSVRNFGCKVAIDDFGAGYSSFMYLKHLNVDIIKIDGLFTHDVSEDKNNQLFIKAIVDIAKGLGCKTVAEFVESKASLDMLLSLGVDMVQGYYLQEPKVELLINE